MRNNPNNTAEPMMGNHMASDEVTLSRASSSSSESESESESEPESSESFPDLRFFLAALSRSRVVLGVLSEENEPK